MTSIKDTVLNVSVLVILLFSFQVSAQQPRNLVFEGAGVRGLAYAGAVAALEERNILGDVKRVGGTSAGAIIALALSLNYNSTEIETIVSEMKLQKFNDGRFFFIGGLSRMRKDYGWYRGEAFLRWLGEIIEKKTGTSDITFAELTNRGFRQLYVTGTSLNNQRLIVFSSENYPDMKIKDAVRISMSIPLYFRAVCIDEKGVVCNCRKSPYADLVIDGGMTGNYPITMFDSVDASGIRIANRETLGIKIDTPEQIESDHNHLGLAPASIRNFRGYLSAFYNYTIENLNRQSLREDDWSRTVSISSGEIGARIRKLSPQEKETLTRNGRQAVEAFLDNHRK